MVASTDRCDKCDRKAFLRQLDDEGKVTGRYYRQSDDDHLKPLDYDWKLKVLSMKSSSGSATIPLQRPVTVLSLKTSSESDLTEDSPKGNQNL